jgi:hypothetical protein
MHTHSSLLNNFRDMKGPSCGNYATEICNVCMITKRGSHCKRRMLGDVTIGPITFDSCAYMSTSA